MVEPAELLLIKDQYEQAFHCLSRGLVAEGDEDIPKALAHYKKARQHLAQGLEVPTGGERHEGPIWDRARQLQQRMRESLITLSTHLFDLETSKLVPEERRKQLLMCLTPNLYQALELPPRRSPLCNLYPTLPPAAQSTTPAANATPARPAHPPPLGRPALSAATPEAVAMANPGDQPPAYTPQPTDGHRSLAYGPDGRSGKQFGAGENRNELLFIPSGVQMFFVAPSGQVSSLFYPGYLRIITFDCQHEASTARRPPAFLDVCGWLYPLTTDTPVLLANSGIFMFPDTLAETPGSYVGIVLSSELPAVDRDTFQDLILQLTEFRIQSADGAGSEVISLGEKVPLNPSKEQAVAAGKKEKNPVPGWSEKMGQGILSGAMRLSQGFVKGAEATSRAIHKGGFKIRDHLTPEDTPSEVKPGVTKGLHVARQATGGAVRVSQFLVNGVSTVAGHVAEKMAPHVKKHGAKLIPESMKTRKDGQPSTLDGAKFVASSSVQGFSTIWSSLETGAKLIGKSVTTETVTTVKYKYGDDAGQATDTALQSVVNVGVTAYNIDNLGVKAILLTGGKQAAKAVLKSPEESEGKEVQKEVPPAETAVKVVQEERTEEKS